MIIEEIMSLALSNGLFASLFVFLFLYQLRDSSKREKKYQETIEVLSKHLDIIEIVDKNVEDIKNIVIFPKRKEKKNEN